MKRLVAAMIVLAPAALAACGGGSDDGGSGGDLVERVPGNARVIGFVDFEAAKETLGLPADADPSDLPDAEGEDFLAHQRLFAAAGLALPYLSRPTGPPLSEAIDHSRVNAAASAPIIGEDSMAVLATDQPFDEIAERLEADGYRRDGDVLVSDEPFLEIGFRAVGAGDGVVAMAQTAEGVQAALDGGAGEGGEELRDLLDEVDAPIRAASRVEGNCLTGVAVGDELSPASGVLLMRAEDGAEAEAFRAEGIHQLGYARAFEFEESAADGDLASVGFDYPPRPGVTPTSLLMGELVLGSFYRC
jgi:hypothetical protein